MAARPEQVETYHRSLPGTAQPLALFERLYRDEPYAFLYESLESDGERGRYSFCGGRPRLVLSANGDEVTLRRAGHTEQRRGPLLDRLRELLTDRPARLPAVAPFAGGLVGYLGYDAVRQFEQIPDRHARRAAEPDACFLVPDELIVFDQVEQRTDVVLYAAAATARRVAEIDRALAAARAAPSSRAGRVERTGPETEFAPRAEPSADEFRAAVAAAQAHISAGDIFQVVLSRRFEFELTAPPLALFAALRETNPSPYLYYLSLGELQIVGSSPEVLVRRRGDAITTRPLAGTRPRGADAASDRRLEAELRRDEKERAEHVMLVDLARNDLGRVCEFGSVRVTRLMDVERYSRVMHLVSQVEGRLSPEYDALDVLRDAFPAGTVSGAPKIRAMQIIDALESARRGVYAGAIGYLGYDGDLDLCIVIRAAVLHGGRGCVQAGAGIVADSDPAREEEETRNKARAVLSAVALAESR